MSTSPSTAHEPLPRFPSAEHDTSDFTAEAGPSKSGRPRIAKACRPCGQQKLRCDGATPCSRCVSLECTDTCVYLPSLRGKTRKKRVDREREAAAKAAAEAEPRGHAAAGIDERRSMSRGHVRDEERNTDEHATIPDTGTEWNSEPHRRFWDRSQQLAESGARNSSLWRDKEDAADTGRTVGLDHMEDRGRRRTNSGTAEHPARVSSRGNGTDRTTSPEIQRRKSAAVDKLTTTLPLPGDAHNPLAVLVELSEVTPPVDEDAEGGTSGTSPGGHAVHSGPVRLGHPMIGQAKEEGYYAPLQRTLKDEAPHIMSLINTHEYVSRNCLCEKLIRIGRNSYSTFTLLIYIRISRFLISNILLPGSLRAATTFSSMPVRIPLKTDCRSMILNADKQYAVLQPGLTMSRCGSV